MYKRTIDNRWSFKDADTKEFTHCYHAYPARMELSYFLIHIWEAVHR